MGKISFGDSKIICNKEEIVATNKRLRVELDNSNIVIAMMKGNYHERADFRNKTFDGDIMYENLYFIRCSFNNSILESKRGIGAYFSNCIFNGCDFRGMKLKVYFKEGGAAIYHILQVFNIENCEFNGCLFDELPEKVNKYSHNILENIFLRCSFKGKSEKESDLLKTK